jgi:hypothetical protein
MKYALFGLLILCLPLLLLAPIIGILIDPWTPWRLSGQVGQVTAAPPEEAAPFDPGVMPVIHGGVTDAFRYQLARAAGFTPAEAIIATAISIAEDGSGDPAALSGLNTNLTRDLGLWQINSAHWPEFGGQQALIDPATNAHAAYVLYHRQTWCAWSTYESSCGPGHTGSYHAYLSRAQAAAQVQPLPGEA